MRRRDVEPELLHQAGEAGCLALRQVEHEARHGRGVDDGVLERALQPTPDEPGVKRVVTVLHEHRSLRETEKGPARVSELRRPDEH